MSKRVEIWDPETHTWNDSIREYTPMITLTGTFREDYEDKPIHLHLYEDEENGLVTTDVAKYESWLAKKGLLL